MLAQRSAVRRRATGTVSDLSKQMRQQRKDLEASMEKDEERTFASLKSTLKSFKVF